MPHMTSEICAIMDARRKQVAQERGTSSSPYVSPTVRFHIAGSASSQDACGGASVPMDVAGGRLVSNSNPSAFRNKRDTP